MTRVTDAAFIKQLRGYSLVTAIIIYRMPDYKSLMQEFIWQDYDLVPKLPALEKFLDFWDREIEGPIHKVEVGHVQLIQPAEIRTVTHEFKLLH